MPSTTRINGSGDDMGKTDAIRVADEYFELVKAFPLKVLRTRQQYDRAVELASRLGARVLPLSSGERDYEEALVAFIREYQASQPATPKRKKMSGLEMLRFLVTESGVTQAQLAKLLGVSKSAASMILNGHRELTKNHIATIAKHFALSPAAFFG